MSVILTRVDERLVHGQVLVAWAPKTGCDRIAVADDVVAGDDWERELVESASDDPPVDVAPVEDAAAWYGQDALPTRIVLLRSLASLTALVRSGAAVEAVNLGGLHHRGGSRRFLDYLYLTRDDIEALRELDRAGVRLVAQDLPGSPAVDINRALAEGRLEFDNLSAGTA